MLQRILPITFLSLVLLAITAGRFQPDLRPEAARAQAQPTATPTAGPAEAPALLWEGDPLPDDNREECAALRLTAAGQALFGPCQLSGNGAVLSADQPGGWPAIVARFAPFSEETDRGRLVFRGQGQIASPTWQRAISDWARFTYLELSSSRAGASVRTVMSWRLGELPGRPGLCRHLVVLSHGYGYANVTPCEGGQVEETIGGWLDTAEWARFDEWLYNRTALFQDNNYFSGLGETELSEAEAAALADWAGDVYNRLQMEGAVLTASGPAGEEAACPEPTAGTEALRNPEQGYCLLYPAGYTVENPTENTTVLVIGSLLNVTEPRLHIETAAAGGRTVEEA